MQHSKYLPAFLAFFVLFLIGCSSGKKQSDDKLGDIDFTVTGKAEAQSSFKKAMLLLHSFEYEDAAEAFLETRKSDPGFVMSYWGEAMTYNHPLWREQDYEKGNKVLQQLAPTAAERNAKAKTELEKDFIKAVDILYGSGNKTDRDSSYSAYMKVLYEKYPGNTEIASFYSLSLIGYGLNSRQAKLLEQAADIAKEVLAKNPRHPGALHYVIHAYDNPEHAAAALATADKYAIVAPDAGHALHMPTHTYLALGLWDKVVSSNEVSWAAEKQRKERKKLDNDALGYHSYYWLLYGYLQQGKKDIARKMVDSMQQYCSTLPSPVARAHITFLKATYLAETGDYTGAVTQISFPLGDLNIQTRSRDYFVKGMNAWQRIDADGLDKIIRELSALRLVEQTKVSGTGLRVCGNINRSIPTLSDLQQTEVIELELKAMLARMKKDEAAAERFLKQATELETITTYAYGPPRIVKPSFEMYGEWLLEMNKPAEALQQFELSLKTAPNKLLSVKGKEEAGKRLKSNAAILPATKVINKRS
ncbi:MAG TPA: hypothetical protein VIZ28_03160 [Chitinophagaceae bacterium]